MYPDRIYHRPGMILASAMCSSLGDRNRGVRYVSSWGVRMEFDPDVNACHVFPLGGSLDRVDPDVKRISFWGGRMEFDSDSNV